MRIVISLTDYATLKLKFSFSNFSVNLKIRVDWKTGDIWYSHDTVFFVDGSKILCDRWRSFYRYAQCKQVVRSSEMKIFAILEA